MLFDPTLTCPPSAQRIHRESFMSDLPLPSRSRSVRWFLSLYVVAVHTEIGPSYRHNALFLGSYCSSSGYNCCSSLSLARIVGGICGRASAERPIGWLDILPNCTWFWWNSSPVWSPEIMWTRNESLSVCTNQSGFCDLQKSLCLY